MVFHFLPEGSRRTRGLKIADQMIEDDRRRRVKEQDALLGLETYGKKLAIEEPYAAKKRERETLVDALERQQDVDNRIDSLRASVENNAWFQTLPEQDQWSYLVNTAQSFRKGNKQTFDTAMDLLSESGERVAEENRYAEKGRIWAKSNMDYLERHKEEFADTPDSVFGRNAPALSAIAKEERTAIAAQEKAEADEKKKQITARRNQLVKTRAELAGDVDEAYKLWKEISAYDPEAAEISLMEGTQRGMSEREVFVREERLRALGKKHGIEGMCGTILEQLSDLLIEVDEELSAMPDEGQIEQPTEQAQAAAPSEGVGLPELDKKIQDLYGTK